VSPGAPGGGERFGYVVWEILEAGSRSTNDLFEEFEHGDRNRQERAVAVAEERERALTTDGEWMDLIECCAVQWCTRETVSQGETHTCFVFVKQCS